MTNDAARALHGAAEQVNLHGRVLALERLTEDRWSRLDRTLSRLEAAIDRMDRRLWIAASACAAAGLGAAGSLLWRIAFP